MSCSCAYCSAEDGRQFGSEDFHRHLAMVLQVLGEVDGRHAAFAKFFLDGVAVGQGGLEAVEIIAHG